MNNNSKIIRVAVTGPESTGKSMLAKQLAEHYNTQWVPEFAREYVGNLGREYTKEDILIIAKTQLINEEIAAEKANKILFCDTELIVTKIWSEHKYNSCDEWILENIGAHKYDLYLLCNIDLPWEADPQREHPHLREYLFDLYKKELEERHYDYCIISGTGELRMQCAVKAIDEILK
jgi:NadR type nicotinamide-nucleotide adenylyltransferase